MPVSAEVAVRDLAFTHDSASEPLLRDLTVHFPTGFTGIVGANGVGKSTLLELLAGLRAPDAGEIHAPELRVHCAQRTDHAPSTLNALLAADDAEAYVLRGRLGIDPWLDTPWDKLSHGERKRRQIGAALWRAPDLLTLDEPTNHIDAPTRAVLLQALQAYRGVGVIVSHDRDLLDALCRQCLWLDAASPRLIAGGYSCGREVLAAARADALRERATARAERDRLAQEVTRRRDAASGSARRLSKRGLDARDHDAKGRIDAARLTGKGTQAGRLLNQLGGRAERAQERLDAAFVGKVHEVGIWLEGSVARSARVLDAPAAAVELAPGRTLTYPDLSVAPRDRVAITGANGSGKSTLLRALRGAVSVAPERLLWIPQEIPVPRAQALLDAARTLPAEDLGRVMQIVSRLGSRPERLLASRSPSPGELRKLMLARGILRAPHLVIMDEPTNHLDLPSIEALQGALADCPCALLLVSHDAPFLGALTERRWSLEGAPGGDTRVCLDDRS